MRQYQKMRNKAEQTGWGINVAGYDNTIAPNASSTVRQWLLERCRWYYDYETLFSQNPNIIAPFLSESGQPDRMNTKPPGHEASGHEDEDTAITDDDKAPRDK